MREIDHPNGDGSIEVEVIDEESHQGDYIQVQATDDTLELSDQSGNAPWMDADEVREV